MNSSLKQQGFTLLELLLACGLSLLLLAAILLCYMTNKKTYTLTEALIRMQENGLVVTQLLAQDIRMAGYAGCGRLNDISVVNGGSVKFLPDMVIAGWHHGHSTTQYPLPAVLSKSFAESDGLLLQKMSAETQKIQHIDDNSLQLKDASGFTTGDILLIADCKHAEVVRVAAHKSHLIVLQTPLLNRYSDTAEIGHLQQRIYYIAKTDRRDIRGSPIYALYRRDLNVSSHVPAELAEGIDNLQVEFGVNNPQTGEIHYFTADHVPDWRSIKLVKLALLVDSIQPVIEHKSEYEFAGKKYIAMDKHLRREWSMTTAVRES